MMLQIPIADRDNSCNDLIMQAQSKHALSRRSRNLSAFNWTRCLSECPFVSCKRLEVSKFESQFKNQNDERTMSDFSKKVSFSLDPRF